MDAIGEILKRSGEPDMKVCKKCGEPTGTTRNLFGKDRIYPRMCLCKRIEKAEYEEKHKAQQEQIRLEQLFNNSLMSKDFKEKTFNNWNNKLGNARMLGIAVRYVEEFHSIKKENVGLLINGSPGVGKTYLSGCIANALLEKNISCVCISVTSLLEKIKQNFSSYGVDGTEQFINGLDNADLLILDDLGTENPTEWSRAIIYQIIDKRYIKKKPIIISTNFTLEEIKFKYDDRTFDRIKEMCAILTHKGDSIREIKHREKTNVLSSIIYN